MVNGNQQLPDGWTWKTIGEVTLPIEKVDPTQKPKKEFTYLDIASIDNSLHKITEPKSYYGADAPSRARQLVKANDVLFSTVRTYLENIAQVPEIHDGQIASTGFSVLRSNGSVHPKYLFYFSLTQQFLEPLNELQRGTSYPAVRDNDVRVQSIPVAPLPEQERIVAKIEELFTQLEAGTSALERVQAGLRRYKASVLKAAVEGKLLKVGADGIRPDHGRLSSSGRTPSARTGELPEGWRLVTIDDVAESLDNKRIPVNKKEREKRHGQYPYYGANGQVDWIDDFIFDEPLVLVVEDETFIGREKPFSYKITGRTWVNNHAHVLRAKKNILDVDYLNYSLAYYPFTPMTTGTTGRKKLTKSVLMVAPYALPPLEEQRRIVAEVERRLSVTCEVESAVEGALARSTRLRQSVLKSAFEGRLG